MGVEAQHEDDEEVVGVPESLKRLLADAGVRTMIHSQLYSSPFLHRAEIWGDTYVVYMRSMQKSMTCPVIPPACA